MISKVMYTALWHLHFIVYTYFGANSDYLELELSAIELDNLCILL